jgi:hypothetical protein
MTLVVVRQRRDIISAVCDTGIIEHGMQLSADKHVPKLCILTPHIAIAFAGNPDLALKYLSNFSESFLIGKR